MKQHRSKSPSFVPSVRQAVSAVSSLRRRRPLKPSKELYIKLDDFQQDAVEWVIRRKEAGLFFEQGTGKTWITGGVLERLFTNSLTALLIVPLNNIETTWATFLRKQLLRFRVARSFDEFLQLKVIESSRATPMPVILLLHYEAVPSIIKKLRRLRWSLIVYDESQRLKARGTLQSRTAAKLRNRADRKLILSGTPIEKQPQDLWAQFRFLAPHVFGTSWKDFDKEFLEQPNIDLKKYRPGSFKFKRMLMTLRIVKSKMKFREDKMDEFLRRIKPYCLRVTKEVLNLPPLTLIDEPVVLRGSQRKTYEAIERDMLAIVNRRRVSSPLKVTQIGKMQQICGGYLIDDEDETHEVGRAKLRRLIKIVDREKKPIVVFCRYLEEVWSLRDELTGRVGRIEILIGKNKKKRPAIIEAFQRGKIDVLITQVRTGGVGIDLYRSCVGVFYSYTYSFIDFEQAISRLHRRGQNKAVRIYLLYAENTIDEAILEAIVQKRKITVRVLTALMMKGNSRVQGQRRLLQVWRRQHRQGFGSGARLRPRSAA